MLTVVIYLWQKAFCLVDIQCTCHQCYFLWHGTGLAWYWSGTGPVWLGSAGLLLQFMPTTASHLQHQLWKNTTMYMHVFLDLTSFPNIGLIVDALLHWPLLSASEKI